MQRVVRCCPSGTFGATNRHSQASKSTLTSSLPIRNVAGRDCTTSLLGLAHLMRVMAARK